MSPIDLTDPHRYDDLLQKTAKVFTEAVAIVTPDGEVSINWVRAEQAAAGNDPNSKAIAQALIAVRDKTYKFLEP